MQRPAPIRILIVSDDPEKGELAYGQLLEPGFETELVKVFPPLDDLWQSTDLVVAMVRPERVDWLAEFTIELELKIPVVVCLFQADPVSEEKMLHAGAQECLQLEECKDGNLSRRVRHAYWRQAGRTFRLDSILERKLRDAEAPYHSLVESLTQNIVSKDLDGRFTFANSNFCNSVGRKLEEIIGKTDADLFPATLAQKYMEDDQRVIESRVPFEAEEAHKVADGEIMVVKVVKTPVFDSAGRITGTQNIFWDITEQKKAQIDLAASQERFELAVRGTADGIWDWDVVTNDVYYSDRFKKLLGFAPDEFGDTLEDWSKRLHPSDRDATLESIKAHLENRVSYDVNYRLMRKDGTYNWYRARGLAIWGASGKATRMAGSLSDISDRKRAEEALRTRSAELEKSNHDLEQFAYIASHDLKEPLRMVSSYVGLLARRYADVLDDDGKEFIQYAVDGAKRMKALIDDLLVFSRVGTKGKDLEPSESRDAVAAAILNLGAVVQETNAKIEYDADSLPTVNGDSVQLIQLFQNLVANAIKFTTPEKTPHVRIAVEKESNGRFWRFSVSDNGIGIDSDHKERIFEIFQRLHNRTEYEGTGIGLAVTRKIVERHGGRISVDSTPGEGSTFTFTLPSMQKT
jgi:PAS domain S-box-containing protein